MHKKIIVVALLFILLSTGIVQGKSNVTQTNQTKPADEDYHPYLEVHLPGETKTFTPTDDTYIENLIPSEIEGNLPYLATRNRFGAGGSDCWECDILIKFDLSSIPPSTPIQSATLNLYYNDYGDTNPAGRPLTVYKITSGWDESLVNYYNKPSINTTVSATENVPGSTGIWMIWNLTNDVQKSVDNPAICFGWQIMDETQWGEYWAPATYFVSKEYTPPQPPFIPYLEVNLTGETKIFTPTDDTYIENLIPNEIEGDLSDLATRNRFGGDGQRYECDILIKFDLSSIPPSTPILSASLNLYYYEYGDTNPAGRPLTVHRITRDWDESRVNYNRRPSKAMEASASEPVPYSVGVGMKWDLTKDVQKYVDNPGINFGWEIMDETHWGDFGVPVAHFYSKEYNAPSYFPALLVGIIANKTVSGDTITFEAVRTRVIYFNPFTTYLCTMHQLVTMQKLHIGRVGRLFIFTFCKVVPIY
jgi:hypothetical protein